MTSVSCVVVVIFEKVYPVFNGRKSFEKQILRCPIINDITKRMWHNITFKHVKIAKLPEYLFPGGFDSPGLVSVCLKYSVTDCYRRFSFVPFI